MLLGEYNARLTFEWFWERYRLHGGTLGFGVIVTLPICIAMPPKAEFCTQKEGVLHGN